MNFQQQTAGYQQHLNQWKWQTHITISFPTGSGAGGPQDQGSGALKHGDTRIRTLLNRIQKANPKMRMAGFILTKQDGISTHCHVILTSLAGYPQTLADLTPNTIKSFSRYPQTAVTTNNQWDQQTICRYLTKEKNMDLQNSNTWELSEYRPKILKTILSRGEGGT